MARYVSEEKLKNVRRLITQVTHFEQGQENFRRCENYALGMMYNHRYLEPHHKDVKIAVEGIIEKLTLHAHFQRAALMQESYDKLINLEDLDKECRENVTKVLHFLMLMAKRPTSDEPLELHDNESTGEDKQEDKFDWRAYLMEGVEIDPEIGRESSDESVWSLDEDEDDSFLATGSDSTLEAAPNVPSQSRDLEVTEEVEEEEEETENWLEEINDSWKATESDFRCKTDSEFPATNFLELWREIKSSKDDDVPSVRVLSEYMVIRELLWSLRDPTASGLVFRLDEEDSFTVATDLAVCSLTPQAAQAALSDFCPVLGMIYKMQTFINGLIPPYEEENREPPSTYRSYACALNIIFCQQNEFLLNLERKVMKQENIYTIGTVSFELQSWVQLYTSLFRVHNKAIEDWKTRDLWICASKLLSVLGSSIEETTSLEMAAIYMSLLFRSLKPYLEMTESWLKSGTLQDPHSEFLIEEEMAGCSSRNSSGQLVLEGNYESRPFESVLESLGVIPLPLLKPLVTQGEEAGRSIQVLQGLKFMSSIPHPGNKESLFCEFVQLVRDRLLPTLNGIQETDLGFHDTDVPSEEPPPTPPQMSAPVDDYLKDYLLASNDVYMLKAFGDILDLGLDVSHQEEHFQLPKEQLIFKKDEVGTVQPLGHVLQECMEKLLSYRVEGLGLQARKLLQEKCRLKFHLSALRGVALLESGLVTHQFFAQLVDQIEEQEDWRRWGCWYLLTNQLQASISQQNLEWSDLFSVAIKDSVPITKTSEITEGFPLMQFLNHLELQYSMEWPITLVLRDLDIYNQVFRFLAKVKCSLISLQKLKFKDLKVSDSSLSCRLMILRSWLLFLLGAILEHLLGHILTTLKDQLNDALESAKDLHSVLAAHDTFLNKMYSYCLLETKSVTGHKMLMEAVALSMSVCDTWVKGELNSEQMTTMETDYDKTYTFMQFLFSNLAHLGANLHMAGIAAALNHTSPPY